MTEQDFSVIALGILALLVIVYWIYSDWLDYKEHKQKSDLANISIKKGRRK